MNNLKTVKNRTESPSTIRDYLLISLTVLLGWTSLTLIMVFMFRGSLNLVNLGFGERSTLVFNTVLSLCFFVQHSGMIRESFRQWTGQFINEKYHGMLYTIVSSIVLLVIVTLWQQSNYTLGTAEGILRWVLRGVFLVSLVGFYWGLRSLGHLDAFGLDPIRNNVRRSSATPSRLRVRGPYRWVRHPLYFFCLLMIWSCPDLTLDRLLFNFLWTAWIVVGTVLEERDLVKLFGEDYRVYQKQVPMLIPQSVGPAR